MHGELFSNATNRAIEKQLSGMELLSVVGQLTADGQRNLVVSLYQTWLEHNSDNALAPAIYFNYGVVLSDANDVAGAKAAFENAIRVNPDFYPPYVNLGGLLDRIGAGGEAVQLWYQMAARLPTINGENLNYKATVLKQIGRVLERGNLDLHAEDSLRQCLDLNSHQPDVVQHYVSLRQRQCKWPIIAPSGQIERKTLLGGISALSLGAYTDDPILQLGNAYMYARYVTGCAPKTYVSTHARLLANPPPRRRVAYLSSDLREHAIGYLTSEVYELHDRSKVEIFAYYCGIKSPDQLQQRVKNAVEHWVDISDMTDEQAAAKMIEDGIEILIDVNGYTNGQRSKLLASRPAPIIVNWLGYPGTLGTAYHNYIIADDFIIPPSHEMFYSEKVLRLPCYQSNDRKRKVSERGQTRAEAGLPENAFVFCCFNGLHKISRFTWARWMSILTQVPTSVIWLLDGPQTTKDRLKQLAQEAGVAPDRLIFANKLRNPDHLARYPLADLFLDTSPYGAHTTCSDALYMGVPLLTVPGRSFASRVCGSLIKSAGVEETIVKTPDEYVREAVALANDPARCKALRARLLANRDTCVLFDTPLLVRKMEDLFAEMWADYTSGKLPIPDLTNLDIYNEVGIELDKDEVDMMTVPDYLGMYRKALAAKAESIFVHRDNRLWPGTN